MHKRKALLLTIVCSVSAIGGFAEHDMTWMLAFAAGAMLFFGIWCSKSLRDQSIITQARLEREATTTAVPTTSMPLPYVSQAYLVSLSFEQYGQFLGNYYQLGNHPDRKEGFVVSTVDLQAGLYIAGVQGGGKSSFMENLIQAAIMNNQSVIVIDPHGDLIKNCIAELPDVLPQERWESMYLLDMEDEDYPFGVNVFAGISQTGSIAQGQAIERILHIFEVLWPEVMSQQYLPRYLRAAIITLIANPGSTLVDMYTFLIDDSFRQRLLKALSDQSVKQFWQLQYDELSPAQRFQRVGPLIGRLESLFMGRSLIRNIVDQKETSIDFRRAVEEKEVIFIKLPIKTLAQDARLIGTLLIAQIHAAIFSFADVPEAERPGFSLFVDEFQHFATSDFSEMFTEGRKFGVRVAVAHQYRGQLPDFLRAASMTVRTKVCFQLTPEDAREMSHLFVGGEVSVRPEDIDPKPLEHLLLYGSDNHDVQTFVEWYLLPLQNHKKGGAVEITRPGFRTEHVGYWLMNVDPPKDRPKVTDPTPYLNSLLYQVMKASDAEVHIPHEIVTGFANCGRGFYAAYRYALDKERLLSPDVPFPEALVIESAHGLRWTHPPEDSKEQLYHFLFHLRATMRHLATSPIGKKTNANPAEIAHTLTQLSKRHALVRSGSFVGRIVTDETMPKVDPGTFQERNSLIQLHTRNRYCRKVEEAPPASPNSPDDEPPISRWEEV